MYSGWDLMTYLRESVDAMAWSHKKYGIGVFAATVKGSLSTEKKDALESTMQDLSSRRGLVLESDDWDGVEWIGPPSSGTTNIVEGNDFLLGLISSATGIPKDIYTGVSAGAITGSEINNKALYATISKIQSTMEPYILELVSRMGYDVSDMVIEWNTRYATDELEQAQIRNLNADAMLKEAQAEQGDIRIGFQQQEGFKDQEKNQNPAGMQ
jgi:hypothetical protein